MAKKPTNTKKSPIVQSDDELTAPVRKPGTKSPTTRARPQEQPESTPVQGDPSAAAVVDESPGMCILNFNRVESICLRVHDVGDLPPCDNGHCRWRRLYTSLHTKD